MRAVHNEARGEGGPKAVTADVVEVVGVGETKTGGIERALDRSQTRRAAASRKARKIWAEGNTSTFMWIPPNSQLTKQVAQM